MVKELRQVRFALPSCSLHSRHPTDGVGGSPSEYPHGPGTPAIAKYAVTMGTGPGSRPLEENSGCNERHSDRP